MKYYIVDDVPAIVKILSQIIDQKNLGEVIGESTDANQAVTEIIAKEPDIVFADLLMPVKDGITLVKEVKRIRPKINFIMISQVSDKELVSEAYKVGVEFFISKPINIIEVETVTRKIMDKLEMQAILGEIRGMFQQREHDEERKQPKETLKNIKYLLGVFGMLGELGAKDILSICEYLLVRERSYDKDTIDHYCDQVHVNSKVVKQRMRRAVRKGLTNVASMGIEDYYNEVFQSYSQMFFEFDNIKAEMDYLRGKSMNRGKVNLDTFMEGMLMFNEVYDQ